MPRGERRALCISITIALLLTLHPVTAGAAHTGYVRMSTGAGAGGASGVTNTDITPDGRYVVFDSSEPIAGDSPCGDCRQVYLHDRDVDEDSILDETGESTTILLSTSSDGAVANSDALAPTISADGRFVSFSSYASNLVSGDTNGTWDVFVVDRDADDDEDYDEPGQTETFRVSLTPAGQQRDLDVGLATISGNGRFVAYVAVERSGPGYPELQDLSMADLDANSDGTFGGAADRAHRRLTVASQVGFSQSRPSLSHDGRFVAYRKESAVRLMDRDVDGNTVYDEAGQTEVTVIAPGGNALPKIDAGGTRVVWSSTESDLVDDTDGLPDAFMFDTATENVTRLGDVMGQQTETEARHPEISPDGTFVAYSASAPNESGVEDIHLVDVLSGDVKVRDLSGAAGEQLSMTNTEFTFWSGLSLTQDDLNSTGDVFASGIGFTSPISGRQSWETMTDPHDVGFERLPRNASSCGPSPKLQSPLAVEGITVASQACFGTHFNHFEGDNSLRLPVGGRIVFPPGAKAVVLLPEPLDGGRFGLLVTDGDGETRSVIGERHAKYQEPLLIRSAAGVAELEVESSHGGIPGSTAPAPLGIVHMAVHPDAEIESPPSGIQVYDDSDLFQSNVSGASPVPTSFPDGAPASCNRPEHDLVSNPYVWSNLALSTRTCFVLEHYGFLADYGTQLQLPPRTRGVLLTLDSNDTTIVQAQRPDGSTLTRFVPPSTPGNMSELGFASHGGIARILFLGSLRGGPATVRGLAIARLANLTPETFSDAVVTGGSATTGSDPTPLDPIETTVKLPANVSGNVTITEGSPDSPSGGFAVVGQQVDITAPAATLDGPLTLTFVVDASAIPAGYDPLTLEILRDGSPAGECPDATVISDQSLDPCVVSRVIAPNGDVTIKILTSHASAWNVAVVDETPPFAAMVPFSADYYLASQLKPAWQGQDPEGGPLTYSVQRRQMPFNGSTFGAFTAWTSTTATTKRFAAAPGTTYCFRVRATDAAANVSPNSDEVCAATPVDDRAMSSSSGTWRRKSARSAYRSTLTEATKKGAALKLKNVRAVSLSLVASRCSTCGKVAVLWKGKNIRSINLKGTGAGKVVYPIKTFGSTSTGDLVLKTTTGGKRVSIDGVMVEKL